jgi:DNA-binding IclR family transcriptional regulator
MAASGFSVLSAPPEDKAVVTDFQTLLDELARIRTKGYALLDEELEHGVVGASAPIRDLNGRVIAAINVSAPKGRIGERLEALGRYVAAAAAELSGRIGAA